MQQHDAGVAGIDAVEHPDVDRIETVSDAVGADRTGGGASASLIGVITGLKATPGNCALPPLK